MRAAGVAPVLDGALESGSGANVRPSKRVLHDIHTDTKVDELERQLQQEQRARALAEQRQHELAMSRAAQPNPAPDIPGFAEGLAQGLDFFLKAQEATNRMLRDALMRSTADEVGEPPGLRRSLTLL